jgi:hypothetical protein
MIFFKYIKQLRRFCFISLLMLFGFNVGASECSAFQLQNNRSSGISVKSNKCSELPYISVGTIFDLAPQGRLWLKSSVSEHGEQDLLMICQNRTEQAIQLEFSDPSSPWLSFVKLKNCSGWIDNKLSCDGDNGEKQGIYCVTAFLKPVLKSVSEQTERTSSVKMRVPNQSIGSSSHLDKQQLLEALKPELKLCKRLNEISQDIRVSWVVQMTMVKMFEVKTPKISNKYGLSECMKSVVTAISYPMFSRVESFNSIF